LTTLDAVVRDIFATIRLHITGINGARIRIGTIGRSSRFTISQLVTGLFTITEQTVGAGLTDIVIALTFFVHTSFGGAGIVQIAIISGAAFASIDVMLAGPGLTSIHGAIPVVSTISIGITNDLAGGITGVPRGWEGIVVTVITLFARLQNAITTAIT
jgi:hypothetical protein